MSNGLDLSCPAEAGRLPLLYVQPAGHSGTPESSTRRVSFSELLGGDKPLLPCMVSEPEVEDPHRFEQAK